MYKLSSEEERYIGSREELLQESFERIARAKQFQLNDYLIAYHHYGSDEPQNHQVLNSYGVPKKFQVVAVDSFGIAYIKELDKSGKPYGRLIDILDNLYANTRFSVDPAFTDAVILSDTEKFNASDIHREKANLHKEITEFNKKHKINTQENKQLIKFLSTCKVGDVLWRSNMTSWIILDINPIPRKGNNSIDWHIAFMKVQTNKGKILNITYTDVYEKALYTTQPRSYNELKSDA